MSDDGPGYWLLNLATGKLVISIHVVFVESQPAHAPAASPVASCTSQASPSSKSSSIRLLKGTYTRMRNPIHVKGLDVDIHGYGLVELHLAYQDGHTRRIHIRAAHGLNIIKRGAPSIISQEQLRKRRNASFHYPAVDQPMINTRASSS
jgi:hypothetical protein